MKVGLHRIEQPRVSHSRRNANHSCRDVVGGKGACGKETAVLVFVWAVQKTTLMIAVVFAVDESPRAS